MNNIHPIRSASTRRHGWHCGHRVAEAASPDQLCRARTALALEYRWFGADLGLMARKRPTMRPDPHDIRTTPPTSNPKLMASCFHLRAGVTGLRRRLGANLYGAADN
jgi:hypothetical protein